ncbi:FMN-dependent NADH-azoreductase [bioreactor metagenome]|uniref:FMN-dependent NADH-azoreductase n=1 Tax=bioreactor metagenome TaxID=1076179 RepID=A0A644XYX6_9ZZZZ
MSKVLYIKANVKPAGKSKTFQVADHFIEQYKKSNPEDEIITLDLYEEKVDFLTGEDIAAVFGQKTEESKNHPILKYAYQFLAADKYVVAAPFWNLGLPAILKAYLDYICITGITFKYTESGPVGLCQGKKAVHIVSRGGNYMEGPATGFEMGDRYLRVLFGFLGITDFSTIAIEGVDIIGVDVEKLMNKALKSADELALAF